MFTTSKEIRLEISTLCNFNCIMCPRDVFRRKKENMSNDLFDAILNKVINELPQIQTLTFSGFGEFCMDPDWKYKLGAASKFFKNINILTNCSRFDTDDLDYLLKHASTIRISLNGFDEKSFSSVHRQPDSVTYKKLSDNILYLLANKKEVQKISLNYLEMDENCHLTNSWIEFWSTRADYIEAWKPHNWACEKAYRCTTPTRKPTCGRPVNGPVQVQVDGTVIVCCFDFNGELQIGDLKTQPFKEIYNGSEISQIRNYHSCGLADKIGICSKCDQRNENNEHNKSLIYSNVSNKTERTLLTSTALENMSIHT